MERENEIQSNSMQEREEFRKFLEEEQSDEDSVNERDKSQLEDSNHEDLEDTSSDFSDYPDLPEMSSNDEQPNFGSKSESDN